VNAKGGNDIVLSAHRSGLQAKVRPVEVETGECFIEAQPGGTARNQQQFIEGLYFDGTIKRLPQRPGEPCRVDKSLTSPGSGSAPNTHHAPVRVCGVKLPERYGKLIHPTWRQVNVLVCEYQQFILRSVNPRIVGFSSGSETALQ